MAYTKQTWDTTSYVNPTRMNHIEDGIKDVDTNMDKVKQIVTGSAQNQYRVLLSTSTTDAEETNSVRKCSGLTYNASNGQLRLDRPHNNTANTNVVFAVGNETPSGTEGNNTGVLRLFGQSNNYAQFFDDGSLTGNRTYNLPDKNGVLALTSDGIGKYSFNSRNTSHTITFSGSGRLRCASFVLICAGSDYIANPIIIAFKGASLGVGTITGVVVSENNLGVTASDLTVTIPSFSSTYGGHTLIKLYPEDEITYTIT